MATFEEGAYFTGSIFTELADFPGANFKEIAHFNNTKFQEKSDFSIARFDYEADFKVAEFKIADFISAFSELANFTGITFSGTACFSRFESKAANFNACKFLEQAYFDGSKFVELANELISSLGL